MTNSELHLQQTQHLRSTEIRASKIKKKGVSTPIGEESDGKNNHNGNITRGTKRAKPASAVRGKSPTAISSRLEEEAPNTNSY